ncbi:carboxylic acid transporter protein-like protein [Trichoderma camerunense]
MTAEFSSAGEMEAQVQDASHMERNRPIAGQYIMTRLTTLKPPMNKTPNPLKLFFLLSKQQWLFFLVGFAGWTWDAFDFFTVPLTVTEIAQSFNKSNADITWGITLVLMFRSIGAAIFGVAADRYGRKWPFIINNILFVVFEMATGFCQTYVQFLVVRALYGIAMGGLYGNAAATALEDCPPAARGLFSGILQQGYAFGYLLATAFSRALVNTTPHGWRPLYWFGAGPPVLIIILRLCLPETETFLERKRIREEEPSAAQTFMKEGKIAVKQHWVLLIYLVLLMAGLNFLAHGTQDLYPTLLKNQYNFSATTVTIVQVVSNFGAIIGGTIIGYCSQIFGRRLSMLCMFVLGAALLYPYTFIHTKAIIAAAFFQQFAIQGACGVVPIHLMELSPAALRTFVVGTSYQLGNLASSASSTIEATIGERFPLDKPASLNSGMTNQYDYGKVICIFAACAYAFLFIIVIIGPEKLGIDLSLQQNANVTEANHGNMQETNGAENNADLDKQRGEHIEFSNT